MKFKFIHKISVIWKNFLVFFNLIRGPDITRLGLRVAHPPALDHAFPLGRVNVNAKPEQGGRCSCDIQKTVKNHKQKEGGMRLDFIRKVSSFQVLYQSPAERVSDVEPTSYKFRNITQLINNSNNFNCLENDVSYSA